MTQADLWYEIYKLNIEACVNQTYYQTMAWRYEAVDMAVKVVLFLVTSFGIATAAGRKFEKIALWVAMFATALSGFLLFAPTDKWARDASLLQTKFIDLRQETELLQSQVSSSSTEPVLPEVMKEWEQLRAKKHQIAETEPSPWAGLLRSLTEDELKKQEQIQAERGKTVNEPKP